MKLHSIFILLLLGSWSSLAAQRPAQTGSAAQYHQLEKIRPTTERNSVSHSSVIHSPPPQNKLQLVAPIPLGTASNIYTQVRTQQNQVAYDDVLDMCLYIHRQDVTIWGGGASHSGKLRYDLSIDGGASFTTDIGPLQSLFTHPARYPNAILENPTLSVNPLDSRVIYFAPTLDAGNNWNGYVNGVADVATSNPATSEFYWQAGANSSFPGGLCEGLPGEYWIVDNSYVNNGNYYLDTIRILKGNWNALTGEVYWAVHASPLIPWSTTYDGKPHADAVNIAFSPDGMHGWIGFTGDLTAGRDSIYQPVFLHSSDGGATWGNPIEVQLDNIAWIADSLTTLWIDSLGFPISSGHATTAFDFDLTVDVNGDVHFGVVIGTAYSADSAIPNYTIYDGLAMFLADVHSENGGLSFDVDYLAPVLTLRGEFGLPDAMETVFMDNYVQVSRSEDGEEVYFSWVDSDTTVIGYSGGNNFAPNLRILGKRVTDDYMTCWKRVTDADPTWDGEVLFPTMSPTMNEEGTENFLPLVSIEMINSSPLAPIQAWYFGNDAAFHDADFLPRSQVATSWSGACYNFFVSTQPPDEEIGIQIGAYPNPAEDEVTIQFELKTNEEVELSLMNALGQPVLSLASGVFKRGRHQIHQNLSELPPGIYFLTLRSEKHLQSLKLIFQ